MLDKHDIPPSNQSDKTKGQSTEDGTDTSASKGFTRRLFLGGLGMAGFAASAGSCLHPASAAEVQTPAAATAAAWRQGGQPQELRSDAGHRGFL